MVEFLFLLSGLSFVGDGVFRKGLESECVCSPNYLICFAATSGIYTLRRMDALVTKYLKI